MGEYAKAESLYQDALRILRKVHGPEHPITADILDDLGSSTRICTSTPKPNQCSRKFSGFGAKSLDQEHPDSARILDDLGALYWNMREYAEAEPFIGGALRIWRKVLGQNIPIRRKSRTISERSTGQSESMPRPNRSKGKRSDPEKVLGPDHPDTANSLDDLALVEFDLGRLDEATALPAKRLRRSSRSFRRCLISSEERRLAYLDIFHPYSFFPFLKDRDRLGQSPSYAIEA